MHQKPNGIGTAGHLLQVIATRSSQQLKDNSAEARTTGKKPKTDSRHPHSLERNWKAGRKWQIQYGSAGSQRTPSGPNQRVSGRPKSTEKSLRAERVLPFLFWQPQLLQWVLQDGLPDLYLDPNHPQQPSLLTLRAPRSNRKRAGRNCQNTAGPRKKLEEKLFRGKILSKNEQVRK